MNFSSPQFIKTMPLSFIPAFRIHGMRNNIKIRKTRSEFISTFIETISALYIWDILTDYVSGCIGLQLSRYMRVCASAYVWAWYTFLWIYCVRTPLGMFRPLQLLRRSSVLNSASIRSQNSFRNLMGYGYIDLCTV